MMRRSKEQVRGVVEDWTGCEHSNISKSIFLFCLLGVSCHTID